MDVYKVDFQNNAAVAANRVSVMDFPELNQLGVDGSRTIMKWCIVDAEHEAHAMEAANATIRYRWGSVLGIK